MKLKPAQMVDPKLGLIQDSRFKKNKRRIGLGQPTTQGKTWSNTGLKTL
jgi:hypothetical protein